MIYNLTKESKEMKVKILLAMNEKRLEDDVNEFIENSQIKVLELNLRPLFSTSLL